MVDPPGGREILWKFAKFHKIPRNLLKMPRVTPGGLEMLRRGAKSMRLYVVLQERRRTRGGAQAPSPEGGHRVPVFLGGLQPPEIPGRKKSKSSVLSVLFYNWGSNLFPSQKKEVAAVPPRPATPRGHPGDPRGFQAKTTWEHCTYSQYCL